MKNIILPILICITSISHVFSQNYMFLEWEIVGVSFIAPTDEKNINTLGFHSELRLNLSDKFSLGFKTENHIFNPYKMFGEPIRSFGITTSLSVTSDYYFHNNINKRGYFGVTVGSFDNMATTESGIDVGGRGFGITPRVGYEFSIFRLTGEYNFVFLEDFPNYFGLRLGINIGGRYKKNKDAKT